MALDFNFWQMMRHKLAPVTHALQEAISSNIRFFHLGHQKRNLFKSARENYKH